ncbi:MAG: hypothetical protein IPM57_03125 [Oligoflexia bacterium]|nr:hypothetical protein [Oligoflexia bacterium]
MKILAVFLTTVIATSVFAGGISGGGGGTIIPDPAGTEFIKLQLTNARLSLLMFFKNLSYSKSRPELFAGQDNIIEKIKTYSLNIETAKACVDFDGQANDGSINSDPNTICISAFTIGQKVSMITAYPQLLALLAHEYSHLMGYDEKQATEFQKEVLYSVKAVDSMDAYNVAHSFSWESLKVLAWLNNAQAELSRNNPDKVYEVLKRADQTNLFPERYPFRAIDKKEANAVAGIAVRINNLRLYTCAKYEAVIGAKDICEGQYENVFSSGVDEMTADDYNFRYYGSRDSAAPIGMVPNLLKNPDRLMGELESLQVELRKMMDLINEQMGMRN